MRFVECSTNTVMRGWSENVARSMGLGRKLDCGLHSGAFGHNRKFDLGEIRQIFIGYRFRAE
jgi:hypothetical protein